MKKERGCDGVRERGGDRGKKKWSVRRRKRERGRERERERMSCFFSFQALHLRDELAERAQELEEELTMAISEMKKLNNANKQMNDVRDIVCYL